MAQHVARTVHARALAVPDAEHAVVRALAVELGLLGTPARGRRDVLVDAGLEHHVVLVEVRARPLELKVEPAERRPAIAADVAGGLVPGRDVALALADGKPRQRLDAGEEDPSAQTRVLVVEVDVGELDVRLVHFLKFLDRTD